MWKRLAITAGVIVAAAAAFAAVRGAAPGTAVAPVTTQEPSSRVLEGVTLEAYRHPVEIRRPEGPPRVLTDEMGPDGQRVTVSCSSCHATRAPEMSRRSGDSLKEFHQGLSVTHGNLACISCHNPGDYDTLRLADGTAVEYPDVMNLCAQCHGPQFRDYRHGAHGGMNGHWDLTAGPRQRNNCIDCHDPHAPKYQGVQPAPGPRDRFLMPAHDPKHGAEHLGAQSHE